MPNDIDDQIPPGAQRFIAILVAMHSLIQVGGGQQPEVCASAAVAIAEATLRRANGVPEPAEPTT
jgi:hypothetical protein